MAIKGKRKSQRRGSQARRRPASAPRPSFTARERPPWYRTTQGRAVAALVLLAVLGLAWWGVARAQESSRALETRREALETYTGAVRALLQDVRPVADEMASAPAPTRAGVELGDLAEDATRWQSRLLAAQGDAAGIEPATGTSQTNSLYSQAVGLYVSAADSFRLAAEDTDGQQVELLRQAGELRDRAGVLWGTATVALDEQRSEADLGQSGLEIPIQAPPPPAPRGGVQAPRGGGDQGSRPAQDGRNDDENR